VQRSQQSKINKEAQVLKKNNWLKQSTQGQLNRRAFLNSSAAFAAAGAAGATLGKAFPARADEPKKGGFMRFGMGDGSQTDILDPATWPGSFTQSAIGGSMCNNLTELLPDGSAAPDLAESYDSSDNAKTWQFKIRKGAAFHNGKTVAPEDVIESMRHHMGEKSESAAKVLLDQVDALSADGTDAVVFKLKGGSSDFPYLLADYHLPIMPAKAGGGMDWGAKVGSGPFILEDYQTGVSAKLKRNPNYYKNSQPYFDEVEFVVIKDMTARTNALVTGEIQFAQDLDAKTLTLVKRNPDINVISTPATRHYTFDMHTQVEPFNNPDVRKALKYAIDREEIQKKVYFGTTSIGNDNPVAKSMKYAFDPQPQYSYNIEKAKEHLKKAGLTSLKVDLSVAEAGFPGCLDAAVLFKEQAAKAGIEINLIREADDGYWDRVWLKKSFVSVDWFGRATCDWLFTTVYAEGAAWNSTHYSNKHFNDLLLQARPEIDEAKRAAIYKEMQQIIHDDGGTLLVAFANYIDGATKKLGHGQIGGLSPMDNGRASERWWFNS
jgi:peptide/nickel transport system substrate-binding protein